METLVISKQPDLFLLKGNEVLDSCLNPNHTCLALLTRDAALSEQKGVLSLKLAIPVGGLCFLDEAFPIMYNKTTQGAKTISSILWTSVAEQGSDSKDIIYILFSGTVYVVRLICIDLVSKRDTTSISEPLRGFINRFGSDPLDGKSFESSFRLKFKLVNAVNVGDDYTLHQVRVGAVIGSGRYLHELDTEGIISCSFAFPFDGERIVLRLFQASPSHVSVTSVDAFPPNHTNNDEDSGFSYSSINSVVFLEHRQCYLCLFGDGSLSVVTRGGDGFESVSKRLHIANQVAYPKANTALATDDLSLHETDSKSLYLPAVYEFAEGGDYFNNRYVTMHEADHFLTLMTPGVRMKIQRTRAVINGIIAEEIARVLHVVVVESTADRTVLCAVFDTKHLQYQLGNEFLLESNSSGKFHLHTISIARIELKGSEEESGVTMQYLCTKNIETLRGHTFCHINGLSDVTSESSGASNTISVAVDRYLHVVSAKDLTTLSKFDLFAFPTSVLTQNLRVVGIQFTLNRKLVVLFSEHLDISNEDGLSDVHRLLLSVYSIAIPVAAVDGDKPLLHICNDHLIINNHENARNYSVIQESTYKQPEEKGLAPVMSCRTTRSYDLKNITLPLQLQKTLRICISNRRSTSTQTLRRSWMGKYAPLKVASSRERRVAHSKLSNTRGVKEVEYLAFAVQSPTNNITQNTQSGELWLLNTHTNRWRNTSLLLSHENSNARIVKNVPAVNYGKVNDWLRVSGKDGDIAIDGLESMASSPRGSAKEPEVARPISEDGKALGGGELVTEGSHDNLAGRLRSESDISQLSSQQAKVELVQVLLAPPQPITPTSSSSGFGTVPGYVNESMVVNKKSHLANNALRILKIFWFGQHTIILITLRRSQAFIEIVSRDSQQWQQQSNDQFTSLPFRHRLIPLAPGFMPILADCLEICGKSTNNLNRSRTMSNSENGINIRKAENFSRRKPKFQYTTCVVVVSNGRDVCSFEIAALYCTGNHNVYDCSVMPRDATPSTNGKLSNGNSALITSKAGIIIYDYSVIELWSCDIEAVIGSKATSLNAYAISHPWTASQNFHFEMLEKSSVMRGFPVHYIGVVVIDTFGEVRLLDILDQQIVPLGKGAQDVTITCRTAGLSMEASFDPIILCYKPDPLYEAKNYLYSIFSRFGLMDNYATHDHQRYLKLFAEKMEVTGQILLPHSALLFADSEGFSGVSAQNNLTLAEIAIQSTDTRMALTIVERILGTLMHAKGTLPVTLTVNGNKHDAFVLQFSAMLLHKILSEPTENGLQYRLILQYLEQLLLSSLRRGQKERCERVCAVVASCAESVLWELMSRLLRKLEAKIVHNIFPLQCDINGLQTIVQPLQILDSVLTSNAVQASRILSVACESVGGTEDHISTLACICLSLSVLKLSITQHQSSLTQQSLDFVRRLESVLEEHCRALWSSNTFGNDEEVLNYVQYIVYRTLRRIVETRRSMETKAEESSKRLPPLANTSHHPGVDIDTNVPMVDVEDSREETGSSGWGGYVQGWLQTVWGSPVVPNERTSNDNGKDIAPLLPPTLLNPNGNTNPYGLISENDLQQHRSELEALQRTYDSFAAISQVIGAETLNNLLCRLMQFGAIATPFPDAPHSHRSIVPRLGMCALGVVVRDQWLSDAHLMSVVHTLLPLLTSRKATMALRDYAVFVFHHIWETYDSSSDVSGDKVCLFTAAQQNNVKEKISKIFLTLKINRFISRNNSQMLLNSLLNESLSEQLFCRLMDLECLNGIAGMGLGGGGGEAMKQRAETSEDNDDEQRDANHLLATNIGFHIINTTLMKNNRKLQRQYKRRSAANSSGKVVLANFHKQSSWRILSVLYVILIACLVSQDYCRFVAILYALRGILSKEIDEIVAVLWQGEKITARDDNNDKKEENAGGDNVGVKKEDIQARHIELLRKLCFDLIFPSPP